jgi:hypothetical protein
LSLSTRKHRLCNLRPARPSNDRDAGAFVDGDIRRWLERDFAVLPIQRDDEKRACELSEIRQTATTAAKNAVTSNFADNLELRKFVFVPLTNRTEIASLAPAVEIVMQMHYMTP